MPQYAIIADHTPLTCPGSSKNAAKHAEDALGNKMPKLMAELGISVIQNLHLDPSHKTFMLVEAPSAEAVRDMIFDSGYLQFNNIDFHLVTPIEEIVRRSQDWGRPFD